MHAWQRLGTPSPPTRVTYVLEPLDSGTRVTLEQSGFTSAEACANTAIGWEPSFDRLAEILAAEWRSSLA